MDAHFTLLNELIEWSKDVPEYDATFLNSIREWSMAKGRITTRQGEALERIATSWSVPCEFTRRKGRVQPELKVDRYKGKIAKILEWAESKPSFNTEFVESISDNIEERGRVTDKQAEAIDNIIRRCRIA